MEKKQGEMTIQEFYKIREKHRLSITENDIDFLYKNLDTDNRNMVSWRDLYSLFDQPISNAQAKADVMIRRHLNSYGEFAGIT
jgi:Ca2+-binding EF-hand superfamily protein